MVLIEPLILIFAIIAIIIVILFLNAAKHLIVNTILGLIILFLTNYFFELGINLRNIWVLLVCALGGIPGAILIIILHLLHIAF